MTEKRKPGRPKKVDTPVVEEVPEDERFSKRPIMSGDLLKIVITINRETGARHIDCGGFSFYEVAAILMGFYKFVMAEIKKQEGFVENEEVAGTTDAVSGSDS